MVFFVERFAGDTDPEKVASLSKWIMPLVGLLLILSTLKFSRIDPKKENENKMITASSVSSELITIHSPSEVVGVFWSILKTTRYGMNSVRK